MPNKNNFNAIRVNGDTYYKFNTRSVNFESAVQVKKITDIVVIRLSEDNIAILAPNGKVATYINKHKETENQVNIGSTMVFNIGSVVVDNIANYDRMNRQEQLLNLIQKAEYYVASTPYKLAENTQTEYKYNVTIKEQQGFQVELPSGGDNKNTLTFTYGYKDIKNLVLAMKVSFNFIIDAPWGEEQSIKSGGFIVKNKQEVYGIAEEEFYNTYALANSHETLCKEEDSKKGLPMISFSIQSIQQEYANLFPQQRMQSVDVTQLPSMQQR